MSDALGVFVFLFVQVLIYGVLKALYEIELEEKEERKIWRL